MLDEKQIADLLADGEKVVIEICRSKPQVSARYYHGDDCVFETGSVQMLTSVITSQRCADEVR